MSAQYPDIYGPNTLVPASNNSIQNRLGNQTFMRIGGFGFTIGTEATDTIAITIQVYDIRGRKWNGYICFELLLSLASFGTPNAVFDDLTVTTGTFISESIADSVVRVQTNADGAAVIVLQKAGAYTFYARALLADRMTAYLTAIAFV